MIDLKEGMKIRGRKAHKTARHYLLISRPLRPEECKHVLDPPIVGQLGVRSQGNLRVIRVLHEYDGCTDEDNGVWTVH